MINDIRSICTSKAHKPRILGIDKEMINIRMFKAIAFLDRKFEELMIL